MKHIHLIGVGGSGLSAIARFLIERGDKVTGSDQMESQLTQELEAIGVKVFYQHQPENILGADVILRSSAIPDTNIEVQTARTMGMRVLKRAGFLGSLMQGSIGIAVAGTHGKTTSAGMIAWLLSALNEDPSFIVGGVLNNLGVNAHAGRGSYFVIEADEYDHMFLGLQPDVALITNVEYDHPDYFASPQTFFQAFCDFSDCLNPGGTLLICIDDPGAKELFRYISNSDKRVISYGLERDATFQGQIIDRNSHAGFRFRFLRDKEVRAEVALQIPGEHNALNAVGVLAVMDILGKPLTSCAQYLAQFEGTGRRFQLRGEMGGLKVIDDYAHHPTEVRATLAAARIRFPQAEIWAVWQPHTYSRTRAFLDEFMQSFDHADHVIITEIYAAREPVDHEFSASEIALSIEHPDAFFVEDYVQVANLLAQKVKPGDVVIVMSAGDADQISHLLLEALGARNETHVGP